MRKAIFPRWKRLAIPLVGSWESGSTSSSHQWSRSRRLGSSVVSLRVLVSM